ncbi:MAG: protein translocase subunit SecF [Clostridia bacterium]|nr:protein translocase subunit SecF [Clostridia bacterium]
MNKLKNAWKKFPLTSHWRIWVSIPFIIIAIAIIAFGAYAGKYHSFENGVNIGIDFKGGTVLTVKMGDEYIGSSEGYDKYLGIVKDCIQSHQIAEEVVNRAKELEMGDLSFDVINPVIGYEQTSGSGNDLALVVKFGNISSKFDDGANTLTQYRNSLIVGAIADAMAEEGITLYENEEITAEYIGASASAKLLNLAAIALCVTVAIILVYVIVRFEVWSSLAAVIALIHDVAMMFCITIICHIQINTAFVSAIITIVAYSINNTIVIFDRVRENNKIAKQGNTVVAVKSLADESVRETTVRNFNSTITTLVMIVLFAAIGTSGVREFAVPVIAGLVAGFYSSMFLSPSLYVLMKESWDRRKAKKAASGNIKITRRKKGVEPAIK